MKRSGFIVSLCNAVLYYNTELDDEMQRLKTTLEVIIQNADNNQWATSRSEK